MNVTLRMFAAARQIAGLDSVELSLPEQATVKCLRDQLLREYPELIPLANQLRFAINMDYAADTDPISPRDEVACIPPVSGG